MNRKMEMNIGAAIFIILGIVYILKVKEIFLSLILIAIGLGISSDIRSLCLMVVKSLWNNITGKETQIMEKSLGSIQQQSKGDAVIGTQIKTERGDIVLPPQIKTKKPKQKT